MIAERQQIEERIEQMRSFWWDVIHKQHLEMSKRAREIRQFNIARNVIRLQGLFSEKDTKQAEKLLSKLTPKRLKNLETLNPRTEKRYTAAWTTFEKLMVGVTDDLLSLLEREPVSTWQRVRFASRLRMIEECDLPHLSRRFYQTTIGQLYIAELAWRDVRTENSVEKPHEHLAFSLTRIDVPVLRGRFDFSVQLVAYNLFRDGRINLDLPSLTEETCGKEGAQLYQLQGRIKSLIQKLRDSLG